MIFSCHILLGWTRRGVRWKAKMGVPHGTHWSLQLSLRLLWERHHLQGLYSRICRDQIVQRQLVIFIISNLFDRNINFVKPNNVYFEWFWIKLRTGQTPHGIGPSRVFPRGSAQWTFTLLITLRPPEPLFGAITMDIATASVAEADLTGPKYHLIVAKAARSLKRIAIALEFASDISWASAKQLFMNVMAFAIFAHCKAHHVSSVPSQWLVRTDTATPQDDLPARQLFLHAEVPLLLRLCGHPRERFNLVLVEEGVK